jgi:glucose dehydrogenase
MKSFLRSRLALALLTLAPFSELSGQTVPGSLEAPLDRFDNFRDWAIYRGDKKAIQYSELDQIHSGNVTQLEVAWEYHHGDPKGPSMYSNPIMIDGLLYFTTP